MGIVGFGSIGRCAAKIANAFGMRVLGFSRHKHPEYENEMICYADSLEQIWRESDVILTACPLSDSTRGIICQKSIDKMKKTAIIINIARGGIVNEAELAEALNTGRIWGYGADVASTEPIRHDNPLLRAKNCYLTPHIAWVPRETRERMLNIVEKDLRSYLAGQRINCVNP